MAKAKTKAKGKAPARASKDGTAPKTSEGTARLLSAMKVVGNTKPKASGGKTQRHYYDRVLMPRYEEQQLLAKVWVGAGLFALVKENKPEHKRFRDKDLVLMQRLKGLAAREMHAGWEVGMPVGPGGITDPFEKVS